MKLSFKKSILLFTTVALGSMLGASADDLVFQGFEDIYTFEQEWKSEAVPKNEGSPFLDFRQGFGQNNQFFIQNKNADTGQKIQIYDQNGFVRDFAESGLGSNFTKDEAGNMIVRSGRYTRPYHIDKKIRIIKADASQTVDLVLPDDCPTARGDHFGFAQGDVFSAQGGKLIITGSNLEYVYVIVFKNGAISETHRVQRDFFFNNDEYLYFALEDHINYWKDVNGNSHFLIVHRSEPPVDMILDESNWTMHTTQLNTWAYDNYGTCNGTCAFAFNGKNYIMFSTQPNWNDGFAIAELGTNDDGTLDGTITNVVARHMNDYTEPMGGNVSSFSNWLNWEPRDSKSIYIYQYFPGYYMARYIFGIKTDETTLDYIVNDGEENETYTVADDILGVYIAEKDPTRVYAKDYGKHRYPSTIKDGETDFVKDDVHLQSDQGWDQSNWVLLDFGSNEEALKYVGKVIKGGTLTGVLTNKLNPTMTVTKSTEPNEAGSYDENHYIGCNFMTPNVQSNIFWHGSTYNFFFVEPKPQEYVKVHWALYDPEIDRHFKIVTDSQLKGSFNVDWSLYPGDWTVDFIKGNAYSFHAIVRYVEGTKAGAVEGNYMVFPLEGGDIVTAIENVSTRGEVASVTYVNMLGVESSEPFAGINIVVTRYTTGETVIKKEMRSNR